MFCKLSIFKEALKNMLNELHSIFGSEDFPWRVNDVEVEFG